MKAKEFCEKHPLILKHYPDCSRCDGEGCIEGEEEYTERPVIETCYACRGTGDSPWKVCEFCQEEAEAQEMFDDAEAYGKDLLGF